MAEPVHFQHFEVPLRDDGSLHELGRGAMGITYKAFDTNLRCFVALKVINAAYLSSDVARQRFLREARAAAALRHPNVATVFHLGEEGGDCFYAMEFVDGETVEAMMKRDGAIPAPIALEIVLQVARALGAAHKQGLVHRDIKPSNLMVVREDDSEFTVKVIDFGLAKSSTGSEGEDAATLTVGGFLGTPHFASPEQLDERDLDVRSDIYSLGVTLFYMLAGRAPFSGSLAQVMSQHLHRDPPLETLSNQPAPVVELLRHMLAKDPAARPQTPADLRHEVEACLIALKAKGAPAAPPLPVAPDNFETQVLDEPAACEPAGIAKGSILAGRYELVEEVRASDFGRVFKAQSLETPGPVAILVLDPSLLASSEACTRIEDQVVALQKLQAPALQKILSLERLEDNTVFLVLEWIEGPSLLDLMRARKALPAPEASPLLHGLATGFQALQAAGIPCPDIASRAVLLCGADISRPVSEWPQVAAKFNPISPGSPAAPPEATLVVSAFGALLESGAFRGNENRAYVYALGSLAYEMLGGVRGGGPSGGTVPIPGLPEAANNALRRALDPEVSFESTAAFLDELESKNPTSKTPAPARHGTSHVQVSHDSPPPLPSRKISYVLIILLTVAVLAVLGVLGGAGYLVLQLRSSVAPPQASPTPPTLATTSPSPDPTPLPEPTPDPALAVLAKARETAQSEPAAALAMLVDLQKSHPDLTDATDALKEFLAAILDRRDSLNPGQIAALRGPLEGAAALNFVDAQVLLGRELRETGPEDALKWTLAAANNGSTDAMLSAGLMLSNDIGSRKKNFQEAFGWFQRAAKLDNHHAMFLLGECYQLGKGVAPDSKLALEWATKAADQNEVHALNQLGDVYNKGLLGVKPDQKKAFAYFSLAKDLGLPDAYGNLGALYITASPEMKDEKMAVEIFKQGIEKENPLSMRFYAMCLEQGRAGLAIDKAGAKEWYVKAAERGDAGAQDWCRKNQVPFTPSARPPR
jgi:serine/threonine protein kinase/TPR repeat protein